MNFKIVRATRGVIGRIAQAYSVQRYSVMETFLLQYRGSLKHYKIASITSGC